MPLDVKHSRLKIISGAQTGADRAALDVALELGLESGGWVPRGRRAEDGAIPDRYPDLFETESTKYSVRTRRNVEDSDATLVLSHGEPSGGTALTLRLAGAAGKPVLHVDLEALDEDRALKTLREWLDAVRPRTLNVAGPRASGDARIYEAVRNLLRAALRPHASA